MWFNGQPVAVVRGGIVYHVHADHLGTPRSITRGSTGAQVWRWDSEPFGSTYPTTFTGGFDYHLRFAGQYFDLWTGLHYNWHRYYDPVTGRYTQADPIGLAGGLARYTYVGGDPLGSIDPSGLEEQKRQLPEPGLEPVCVECYVLGIGRLAYDGVVRGIPFLARSLYSNPWEQAAYANAARNSMKDMLRGPAAPFLAGWHQPTLAQAALKYGHNPVAIVDAAGRTNAAVDAGALALLGVGVAVGSPRHPHSCPKNGP